MEIREALAWLDGHLDHESSSAGVAAGHVEGLSLAPMAELVHVLGDPQDALPVIHVTGTNGKGSVGAMLTRLLMANGLTVGTYSSPHLGRVNERIATDGIPIDDRALAEALSGVAAVEPLLDTTPTWFEILTAAAFRHFADAPVDAAVVEVGLLGRYDATNVVTADVAVVTGIAGDHTDFTGDWELAVAQEKAGIVTPGRPAVLGRMRSDLVEVFAAEGADPVLALGRDLELTDTRLAVGGRQIDLEGPRGSHHGVLVPVHGAHQADNAAVAVVAAEELFGRALDEEVVTQAFADLHLPGRLEVVHHQPLVVLDGAHNADALAAMAGTLDEDFAVVGSRVFVIGMLAGRDASSVAEALVRGRPDLVLCTSIGGERSQPAAVLASACEAAGLPAEAVEDPATAVARAVGGAGEEDLVVVAGSFRLLETARALVVSDGTP